MAQTESSASPVQEFSQCHAGIFRQLDRLGELPQLLAPAAKARETADKALDFFRAAVFEHHLDEERELFPAVLAAAMDTERAEVTAKVDRLVAEHRELEGMWKRLEGDLKKVAKGNSTEVDVDLINRLVQQYRAHARFEEVEFLPLAQQILGRNSQQMAELGLSLHLRHQPQPVQSFF